MILRVCTYGWVISDSEGLVLSSLQPDGRVRSQVLRPWGGHRTPWGADLREFGAVGSSLSGTWQYHGFVLTSAV